MTPAGPIDHHAENALDHARKDFVQVLVSQSIGEALSQIQRHGAGGPIIYFYLVDEEGRLQGVIPTRRLLLNPPETPVADLMVREVVTLPATATLLDACEQFIQHRFLAFPIVDDQRRILGVVDVGLYTHEISDLVRREESEDVFQLIGVRLSQVQRASLATVLTRRFPWLLCNIAGGLACALLAGLFETVLAQVVALSLFIPVSLTVAESVAIQTLTLALQARHGNRFPWRDAVPALTREIPVGLILGAACGLVVALVVLAWQQRMGAVALSILLSMSLAAATAVVLGLLVPTLLHTAQRDPKVASGPIVLAATDLATLFYYLGLATWLVT
jgi:magnesium transporter